MKIPLTKIEICDARKGLGCWIFIYDGMYWHFGNTLLGALWAMVRNWRDDRSIVG